MNDKLLKNLLKALEVMPSDVEGSSSENPDAPEGLPDMAALDGDENEEAPAAKGVEVVKVKALAEGDEDADMEMGEDDESAPEISAKDVFKKKMKSGLC